MNDILRDEQPIFVQIAELIENAILAGEYQEESQVPSITEISVAYKINPATALKGINLLVDSGLIYKKRGLGMFVSEGAKEKLINKRREGFMKEFIIPMIRESKRLGITRQNLELLIGKGYDENGNYR